MITACYIHVPGCPTHAQMAHNYLTSIINHPAGCEHRNLVICQGHEPEPLFRDLFKQYLPNCEFFLHDDSGLDIGGYQAAARAVKTPIMLCMGGSTTVRRAGWMARMVEAWAKHGVGFYGSLSSNQMRPHFNTTGFWCAPGMLIDYHTKVVSNPQRYEFEHGANSCWWNVNQMGFPTKLVTWCGEYDWWDFRKPPNISCRGDQSNCLTYFRINYNYDHYVKHDPGAKANLEYLTDSHIVDQNFNYSAWALSMQSKA